MLAAKLHTYLYRSQQLSCSLIWQQPDRLLVSASSTRLCLERPNMIQYAPGLYKYTKTLGLLLRSDFLATLIFASFDLPGADRRHDAYDFYWQRLKQIRQRQHTHYIEVGTLDNTVHYDWVERFQLDLRRGIRSLRMKVDPGAARMWPVS